MKKPNNKYLLFGLVGLLVVGAVIVLTQSSGQMFQGALVTKLPGTTTTYSTTTVTLDSVNKEVQALKARVTELESFKNEFYQSYKKNNEATCAALFSSGALHPYMNLYDCNNKLLSPL